VQLGIDSAKLCDAVAYTQARETKHARFADQRTTFGEPLSSPPSKRASISPFVWLCSRLLGEPNPFAQVIRIVEVTLEE